MYTENGQRSHKRLSETFSSCTRELSIGKQIDSGVATILIQCHDSFGLHSRRAHINRGESKWGLSETAYPLSLNLHLKDVPFHWSLTLVNRQWGCKRYSAPRGERVCISAWKAPIINTRDCRCTGGGDATNALFPGATWRTKATVTNLWARISPKPFFASSAMGSSRQTSCAFPSSLLREGGKDT